MAQHWTGLLTVQVKPPADVEALRRNPLGIYVDAIDWAREIEPAAASRPSLRPVTEATDVPTPDEELQP